MAWALSDEPARPRISNDDESDLRQGLCSDELRETREEGTLTPDCGVIYVATQELKFVCEAIASAESVRRLFPHLSITLFTDLTDDTRAIPPFDMVRTFELPPLPGIAPWSKGLYARVVTMGSSPYRRTVSLDTDTRVLRREFIQIFDYLEHHTLVAVPCAPEHSYAYQWVGPMFNGGMIGYRRDEYSARLFRDWEALQRRHLGLLGADDLTQVPYEAAQDLRARQVVLGTNQPSLALLVKPGQPNRYGMTVKELPYAFNAHGCPRDQLDGIVVDHFVSYKVAREGVADFLKARDLEFLQHARARPSDAISVLGVVFAGTSPAKNVACR